jgi:putative DNA primase/helicase
MTANIPPSEFLTTLYGTEPEGYSVLWSNTTKKSVCLPACEAEEIEHTALELSDTQNVYYGVGLQKNRLNPEYRGKADTICAIPGLWVDIDYLGGVHTAKNLPTRQEALDLLNLFSLKPSIIVDTGGGFHVYYLFDRLWVFKGKVGRGQAADLLQRFQAGIIALAAGRGWKVDNTGDLARVLRLPGTLNHKTDPPKTVAVGTWEPERRYTGKACLEAVERLERLSKGDRPDPGPDAEDIPEWDGNGEAPPAAPILEKCAFLRYCRDEAATLSEPPWYAMLSIIARTTDGADLCHELSAPYPGYTPQETDAKIDHALQAAGPATCGRIRRDFGEHCQDCPNGLPDNASPLVLGRGRVTSESKSYQQTDMGNADRLIARYGQNMLHCKAFGWLTWDGKRWVKDDINRVVTYAKRTVKKIFKEAADAEDDKRAKELGSWATRSQNVSRIMAMIKLAECEVPSRPNDFDNNKWLLNVKNGTLDLRTGKLHEHEQTDRITKIANVDFDPSAKCPTWLRFINDVMLGDEDLIEFIQRAVGYSLTGEVSEDVLIILHGQGGNGKSVFVSTIQALCGEYAKEAAPDLLIAKGYNGHPTEIADLAGARVVFASETEEGKQLAENLVKKLTGGDKMKGRFMRQDFFEFDPTFTIWLMTNHKPIIKGTDEGIWRRIRLVPFLASFPKGDPRRDEYLDEKLLDELPGILNWAVEGCFNWQMLGLNLPEAVKAYTEEYRVEMDIIAEYIEECCVTGENATMGVSKAYEEFRTWSRGKTHTVQSLKAFSQRMNKDGYATRHTKKGNVFVGVGLKEEETFC